MGETRAREALCGVAAFLVAGVLVALVVAAYGRAFTGAVEVSVDAGRAGLLTDEGAEVTWHGQAVGRVSTVTSAGDGAVLGLALDPRYQPLLAPNVTARIAPSTVFGAKSVELVAPAVPEPGVLRDGAAIRATAITPELNTVFQRLSAVVTSVRPARVNATLGAMASALGGRGALLGDVADLFGAYAGAITPAMTGLGNDLNGITATADSYHRATLDLLRLLANLSLTSHTVADEDRGWRRFLTDLTHTAEGTDRFLGEVRPDLVASLRQLAPVTGLVGRFSPEISCTVIGFDETRKLLEPAQGSDGGWARAFTELTWGQEPYRYPRDLPRNAATNGPACYGLPRLNPARQPEPRHPVADGSYVGDGYTNRVTVSPLAVALFGVEAARLVGR